MTIAANLSREGPTPKACSRGRRIEPTRPRLMDQHALAYADARRPSARNCYERLRWQIEFLNTERERNGEPLLTIPSLRTFHRAVAGLPPIIVAASRHGVLYAARKHRAASIKTRGDKA